MATQTYTIKKEPEDFIVEEITKDHDIIKWDQRYSFQENTKGDQLICAFYRKNWNQNKALKKLCNFLKISRKRVGYAGKKDKRAVTSQHISIWKTDPERARHFDLNHLRLQPRYWSPHRLRPGDLWGNRFTIRVYTHQGLSEVPQLIPNYFGPQRFGKVRPITHLAGRALINEQPEKAVQIYLTYYSKQEPRDVQEARIWLRNNWGSFKKALDRFPPFLSFERTLLHHLSEHPGEYVEALQQLPKFIQLLFIHAFQSFLFNKYLKWVQKQDITADTGPLFGYETTFQNDAEREFLQEMQLTPGDFRIQCLPELSEPGDRRPLFVPLHDFELLETDIDHLVIRFSLPKGSYATVALDTLFR